MRLQDTDRNDIFTISTSYIANRQKKYYGKTINAKNKWFFNSGIYKDTDCKLFKGLTHRTSSKRNFRKRLNTQKVNE
jgi:hypothetical protein